MTSPNTKKSSSDRSRSDSNAWSVKERITEAEEVAEAEVDTTRAALRTNNPMKSRSLKLNFWSKQRLI